MAIRTASAFGMLGGAVLRGGVLRAQSSRHSVTVVAGMSWRAQRNELISPLQYRGAGVHMGLEYRLTTRAQTMGFAINVEKSKLNAVGGGKSGGHQALYAADIALSIRSRRQTRSASNGASASVVDRGVRFDGIGSIARVHTEFSDQYYGGPAARNAPFLGIGLVTVAPTFAWSGVRERSEITGTVAVPLLAVVERPYSQMQLEQVSRQVAVGSLDRLLGFDATIDAIAHRSTVNAGARYQFGASRVRSDDALSTLTSALGVTIGRGFGNVVNP
jgi:hypothetical protein